MGELTSFYGIREYHKDSFLHQHVDRIDTHVLSVTLTVDKRNLTEDNVPWPLRVTDWTGKQVAYDHPPGTMILYESSKLPHGRPTYNNEGVHLGAFVHYKPTEMHGTDAGKWDEYARQSRRHQRSHTEHANYRETPVIEPENIVFADTDYGTGSLYQKAGESDSKRSGLEPGQLKVFFQNNANRAMALYWYSEGEDPVYQGTVDSNMKMELITYA